MVETAPSGKTWIVQFTLRGEWWGIPFAEVQEVVDAAGITAVPRTPAFISGITHQRGKVITVIDLAALLRMPSGEGAKPKLLWLASERMNVALLIKAVISTTLLPEEIGGPEEPDKDLVVSDMGVLGRTMTLKDARFLNLLEADKIVRFLEGFEFS